MTNPLNLRFLFAVMLAVAWIPDIHAQPILEWNLNSGTTATGASTNTSGLPLVAGISGGQMTGGGVTGNSSSPSGTWNRTFGFSTFTTNGTNITTNNFGYTNFASAMAATNYFSWTTTASSNFTVTITNFALLQLTRNASGPTNAGLFYSTDGTNFTQTGTDVAVGTASTPAASAFGSTFSTNPLVFSNNQIVYWRLVAFGGTNGRIGILANQASDFQILGNSVPAVPPQNLVWVGGNGTWATGAGGWSNGTNTTNFAAFDNATINTASTIAVNAAGVSAGSLTVNLAAGTAALSGGPISSPTLTKSGNGTLVLATSNTISASTITAGAVVIDNARAFGSSVVAIDAAKLVATNTSFTSIANQISLGTNGTVVFDAGSVIALTAAVITPSSGSSNQTVNFKKTGLGTLTISNAFGKEMLKNSTTTVGAVALDIDAGTLVFAGSAQKNIGNNAATTNVSWNGNVVLSNTTVMSHGTDVVGSGSLTIEGSSTLASRFNYGTTRIALPVAVNGNLANDNSSGAYTEFTGLLSGAGGITASGSGAARFYFANSTYTGAVTVSPSGSDGSTQLYSQAFATASSVTVNVNTNAAFIAGYSGELSFRNPSDGTFGAPITGAGGIEMNGAEFAEVLLTASNSYTGKTFLNSGDLAVNSLSAISTNDIVANGTASRFALGSSAGSLIIPNNVVALQTFSTNASNVVTTNTYIAAFKPGTNGDGSAKTITLTGLVSGGGILKLSGGGNLIVSNTANSYAGGTEIGNGSIVLNDPRVLSTGPINFGTSSNSYLRFTANATNTNPITISGIPGDSTNTSAVKYTANFSVDAGLQVVLSSPIANKTSVGTNAADQKFGGRVEKWGPGTLVFAAANTFSEMLELNQGTLVLSNNAGLGATNTVNFNGGTLLLAQASGEVAAGDLVVDANSVLDLGSGPSRTIRFTAPPLATNAAVLTVSNTANGSIYFPTDSATNSVPQIKSAESPLAIATISPETGLLSFTGGVTPPSALFFTPSSQTATVGVSITNMVPSITGTVTNYSVNPALPSGLSISPTSGIISGTPLVAAASASYTVTASNAGGSTSANVTIAVLTAYDSWASDYGLNPATNGSPTADPDGDGFNNSSEYAFGTNPTVASAALLATSSSGGNLTVSWIERNSNLTYSVQSTVNLATTPFANDNVSVTPSANQSGVPSGYTRKQFTVSASGAKFYRVRATPIAPAP